jgi:hypothetical protein
LKSVASAANFVSDDLLFLQVESPLQGGEGLVVDFAPVPHVDGFGAFQA